MHRGSCADRVGLTLCYGDEGEDGCADIYIGEVETSSLAGRNGRIRAGDQILQVSLYYTFTPAVIVVVLVVIYSHTHINVYYNII